MGNSTIIEINHDTADQIFENPEQFMEDLRKQIQYGYVESERLQRDDGKWRGCRSHTIHGTSFVAFSHREDPIYEYFKDFKQSVLKYEKQFFKTTTVFH